MILKKGSKRIFICNYCLQKRDLDLTDDRLKGICRQCLIKKSYTIRDLSNPIKRLKWWIILFKYEEEGYEVERR